MILILLLLAFLLLLSCAVIALVVRPHYQGYAPSPKSKATPLGEYRLRRIRFDVPLEKGVKRAQERVYVPHVEDEV